MNINTEDCKPNRIYRPELLVMSNKQAKPVAEAAYMLLIFYGVEGIKMNDGRGIH